jgi:hypothetical chaperone protein
VGHSALEATMRVVGIDFGTTHSAIAVWEGSGAPRLATFSLGRDRPERTPAFRSILHFEPDAEDVRRPPRVRAGPAAIERYLETSGDGRLVQSIKSFLASPLFERTEIFGSIFELEDLVGRLIGEMREAAERELGPLGARVVVGRPVRFAGDAAHLDERLALSRLRSALARAGFHDVTFELEPVAAAHHYGLRIESPELVLIGDFGGGTSDFSVLRLAPGAARAQAEVLGTSGVGVAGDAFDAKLVRERVAPALGRGTRYRNPFGEVLPVPSWLFAHLERWHHLSFLKSPATLALLADLEREALEPARLRAFRTMVREDRGFHVYRAIEAAKHELSRADASRVRYRDVGFAIDAEVLRSEFEGWIADELRKIERAVDDALAKAGTAAPRIDRVFLTGGSALVPAVRSLFERRFGADKLRGGEELTSVASGLALRAAA